MSKYRYLPFLLGAAMILSGCGSTASEKTSETGSETNQSTAAETSADSSSADTQTVTAYTGDYADTDPQDPETVSAEDAEDSRTEITGDFSLQQEKKSSTAVTVDGNVYTITEEGTYYLSGVLAEGRIVVDAPEDAEVTLILNGTSITCSDNSPIYVLQADKVKIQAAEDTFNEIIDARDKRQASADVDEETADTDDTEGSGAIYAKSDLVISGDGALVVTGGYNNGIHSTKDLKIKSLTLKVTGANNALKGGDSLTVESGNIIAIAVGGDGLKTSDSDVSEKGNQRGTVSIEGGTLEIYAACDGIQAAYDVDISGDAQISIATDSYSDYTGEVTSAGNDFYLIVADSDYSEDKAYYGYYYNTDSDTGVWVEGSWYSGVRSGRSIYEALLLNAPSGYENVAFYVFDAEQEPSLEDYIAVSEGDSVNSSMNGFLLSGSEGTVDGEWVSLSTSSSGGAQEYSTKGIKADNSVNIESGTVVISATDDAIHANNDVTLESGENGTGDVTVSGGTLALTSGDDGIHADNILTIAGGQVHVISAYEGLEANQITVDGGSTWVYATDDGLNASSGSATPLISVNGGYLEVETPSGDTDAIDSNGSYEQTGGFVIVKGGASSGSVAGSVDVESSVSVNGGTIIALGGICETPDGSCNAYAESGTSLSEGSYELTDGDGNTILTLSLDGSYSSFWVASDRLTEGSTYTLASSSGEIASWTQEEGTMGSTGNGMGGFGGMGGGMPGGMGGRR